MSGRRSPQPRRISLEGLETREVPTANWLTEPFQQSNNAGLPSGWSQWSSDQTTGFRVDANGAGLGDQGRLLSTGRSTTTARAWANSEFSADLEVSGAIYLNSTVPMQLFVRGQNLHTASASYYSVGVARGGEVELVQVLNGTSTVLGRVKSSEWVSNQWMQVTLRAEGTQLKALVFRGDTNQYLGSDGTWGRQPNAAIQVNSSSITRAGRVGFARPARTADEIPVDNLRVGSPSAANETTIAEERFDRGRAIGLPAGWTQWTQPGQTFRTEVDQTLRIDGQSTGAARAWLSDPVDAKVQVSSSIYVDSLVPAGIFARGSNLSTQTPTYYGLALTRGLEVQLVRVVSGKTTVLGTIRSKDYISGMWVQASMSLDGGKLKVQVFRADLGRYLNADGSWGLTPAWAIERTDTAISSGGRVGLSRGSGYAGQVVFDNFIVTVPVTGGKPGTIPTEGDKPTTPTPPPEDLPGNPTSPPVVSPPPPPPVTTPTNAALPAVPQHYSWIRLANLAYYGTPMGAYEQNLLRNSIDLVIPNLEYLDDIAAISPSTPQLIYTNVSNIYLGLLTDWNEYADRNRISRENAFYHVTKATTYNGLSASAVPVNQFWGVYRGNDSSGWTNLTSEARSTGSNVVAFGATGQSVALGYLEQFRELNVQLKSGASGGWKGQLEYVTAIDSAGRPTVWKTLTLNSDTSRGFLSSGTLTFDPPKDWVASSMNGSSRLYYIRVRSVSNGTAPVATTLLGRDYTQGGKIPAFDHQADTNKDGYLSDAEYAKRRSGFDARFVYESRLLYPNYGPNRPATNISNPAFRAWAIDYHVRIMASQPLAKGFFVDNSSAKLAVDPSGIAESLDNYASSYGSLLGAINQRLNQSGKWIIANTAGGGTAVEWIARNGVSSLDEFALRPLSANTVQFEDLAASVAYRQQLAGGKAYQILDSLPTNGVDATNPRLQMATLAMYYLVADPKLTFLMLNGGNEPASAWNRHWIEAAKYNVGSPTQSWSVFATGADPANRDLTYKIYQRQYQNALVLYKPVSYTRGQNGTTADNTKTTHTLNGWYRTLNADGTMGNRVNQITLRNGEGAILVKVN